MLTQSGREHPWFKHTKGDIHPEFRTIGIGGRVVETSNGRAKSVTCPK